jgi:hypothetical protein
MKKNIEYTLYLLNPKIEERKVKGSRVPQKGEQIRLNDREFEGIIYEVFDVRTNLHQDKGRTIEKNIEVYVRKLFVK